MTTFTWSISQLDRKAQEDNLPNVVITAHWRCTGVFADTYGSVYSTCSFPPPDGDFTPYNDLTEAQVLGWCWENGVDKAATEAAVDAQIQQQIAPSVISSPPPWAQP